MDRALEGGTCRYTTGEEILNAVTHGLGTMFAVSATTLMITASVIQLDGYKLAASIVYGLSLVVLYLMSTLYHAIRSVRVKEVLRVFDHCSIFFLIAGTYTPFTLVALRETPVGWPMFAFIWGAAILGVVLNIISIERFKIFSMICYVAMGWTIVFSAKTLLAVLPIQGVQLLVAGGIAYTGGIIFYVLKKHRYFHGIWHLFVLAGSVLHFLSAYIYVIL